MIMVVNQLFPWVIIVVAVVFLPFVFSSLSPSPSNLGDSGSDCNRNCPAGIWNGKRFPHPFGFSPGCQIQLTCSKSGEIKIGEFRVANVTAESILIDLPVNCSRPIEKLKPLFGRNYRMTSRNGLFLQNCRSPINGCSIPIDMFKTRLGSVNCDSLNTSCYSDVSSNFSFLDFDKLRNAGCGRVFSSIAAIDLNKENGNNSSWSAALSLEFQIVELGWWLEGNCVCGENAKCINVSGLGNVHMGYRCQCLEGYIGDGFVTGDRCRKVTEEDEDDYQWFKSPGFYGSVVVGFAIGFWGVCGPLVLYAPFRHTYFRFLDRVKDSLLLAIALQMARWLN